MRGSKLEIQIDILKFLTLEPMKLTGLVHKTDLSQNVLNQHLDFLVRQNLVEEQNLGKDSIFYAVTRRGLAVLDIIAPTIEIARKSQLLSY